MYICDNFTKIALPLWALVVAVAAAAAAAHAY